MNKKASIFIAIILISVCSLWYFNAYMNNDDTNTAQEAANLQPDTLKDAKNTNDIVVDTQDSEENKDTSNDTDVERDIKLTEDVKTDDKIKDTISDIGANISSDPIVSSPDEKKISPQKSEQSAPKNPAPSPEALESEIIDRYSARFLSLKNESISRLNALIAQGKKEYNNISESEKMSAKIKLGLKYLSLGQKLESECDTKFNSILKEMETELKNNDLSTNAVKEAQTQYEAEKKARRSALLKKFKQ